jgi:hypothetical protein
VGQAAAYADLGESWRRASWRCFGPDGPGDLDGRSRFTLVIVGECAVLALNRGRCSLTDIAARYTDCRLDNFDIYLALWLAGTTSWCLVSPSCAARQFSCGGGSPVSDEVVTRLLWGHF